MQPHTGPCSQIKDGPCNRTKKDGPCSRTLAYVAKKTVHATALNGSRRSMLPHNERRPMQSLNVPAVSRRSMQPRNDNGPCCHTQKWPVGREDGPCCRTFERRPMLPHSIFLSGPQHGSCYRILELTSAAVQHSLCGESRQLCCCSPSILCHVHSRMSEEPERPTVGAAAHITAHAAYKMVYATAQFKNQCSTQNGPCCRIHRSTGSRCGPCCHTYRSMLPHNGPCSHI